MKHIFTYLLIISLGINIYFSVIFWGYKKISDDKIKLDFWKDISHQEGYNFLENKMKMDFPQIAFKQKACIVYFWDSINYDYKYADAMQGLDSLASNIGEYKFNYIFATEMDEDRAKSFLNKRGATFRNFKVLGGMDDFMSGVYNEKPIPWKHLGGKHSNSNCPDMSKKKIKGYYLLMNNKGEILYHNYKDVPLKDTIFMKKLNSFQLGKQLKQLD